MAPKHKQLQIFIQANITVRKKLSGHFIKVFYKMTTCPRQPILSCPKKGRLIQV